MNQAGTTACRAPEAAAGGPPPPRMISAAAFLKRHEPWLRHTPRATLLPYLEWYWRDGRVGIVRENGRIVALALGRCVDDVETARRDPYHHDEQGRIVWLDHLVSRHPAGLQALLRQEASRFGPREAFAGEVFNRAGELRMLPWRVIQRFITGGQDHGFTIDSRATAAA